MRFLEQIFFRYQALPTQTHELRGHKKKNETNENTLVSLGTLWCFIVEPIFRGFGKNMGIAALDTQSRIHTYPILYNYL